MCFLNSTSGGRCFPLRFGSDYYEKMGLEELLRTDQNGWQEDRRELSENGRIRNHRGRFSHTRSVALHIGTSSLWRS